MKQHKKILAQATAIFVVCIAIVAVMSTLIPRVTIASHGDVSISLTLNDTSQTPPPPSYDYGVGDKSLHWRYRYIDGDGEYQYIDNSWYASSAPWVWEMTHDDYHVRVLDDITAGQVIEVSANGSTIAFQPMALEWTNNLEQIQAISMPTDVFATLGHDQVELVPGLYNDMGYIRWDDSYGDGIDFQWQNTPGTLEKVLEVGDFNNLPIPESYILAGGNVSLRLNLIFDPSSDLDIYVGGNLWDKNTKVQTFEHISFQNSGEETFSFKPLFYWDADGNDGESIATLDKKGNSLYISIMVPYSWLQAASYPVNVDADVTIDSGVDTYMHAQAGSGGIFWTSTTAGYAVYCDADGTLSYSKTSNSGSSWASPVALDGTSDTISYDAWADWQTSGDSGTKIHIVYADLDDDKICYVYLDTSGDSIGSIVDIETCQGTGTFSSTSSRAYFGLSITKGRGGKLYMGGKYADSGSTIYSIFYTSSNGSSWASKNHPMASTQDDYILFPANLADSNDIWALYQDRVNEDLDLKTYDDDGDSWGSNSIDDNIEPAVDGFTIYRNYYGAVRHSDGHLIVVAWNLYDSASADLMTWDVTNGGTITAKTNILTDSAESFLCSGFIDQTNDYIYVSYCKGTAIGSAVTVYYQYSDDGATTWEGQTAYRENPEDDLRWISSGCHSYSETGYYMPMWFNDDTNDLMTNTNNAVAISGAGGTPAITNTQSTWSIGVVGVDDIVYFSATGSQDDDYSQIENTGDVAVDVEIQGQDIEGGSYDWALASSTSTEQYSLYANSSNGSSSYTIEVKSSAYNDLIADLPVDAVYNWSMKFTAPSAFNANDDGEQKSATVTLVASEAT